MNVYDFDKTIYKDDSSIDFYKFNLKSNPKLIKYWPEQVNAARKYKMGKITKTEMKTIFYRYLKDIEDMNAQVTAFWDTHIAKVEAWYLEQKQETDIIVSASPEFLLRPVAEKLGFALIASVVDPRTGRNLRENCYGDEKVVRFKEHYNLEDIDKFYSDSYSDDPLAQYAKEAYMVTKHEIKPW